MIGRLTGKIEPDERDGDVIVVDVAGVGYELFVPLGAPGRARVDEAGRVTFYVHTHVREDVLALYGFVSEADRAAFRCLLGVSSVGPRTALAVMSALPAEALARAIAAKDLKALTAISGIGKKTGEMILLQLRDKLVVGPERASTASRPISIGGATARSGDVLASALVGLGYRASDAERAVAALGDRLQVASMPELLREALSVLSK